MNAKILLACGYLLIAACGSSGTAASSRSSVKESLNDQNRGNISLLSQIRRLPGIAIRNGVPVFTKSTTDITGGIPIEPLYVLDGYPVGNSFNSVDQLVDNTNVMKIEALSDAEASFYGSRGANGVIVITTKK